MSSRGHDVFVRSGAFCTSDCDPSLTARWKYVQKARPTIAKTGYGRPSACTLPSRRKTNVNTSISPSGWKTVQTQPSIVCT